MLQPTACPFGFVVQDRIVSPPTWSITAQPTVSVVPDGAGWRIPPADAVAHIEVDIRSLFDGSVEAVTDDVPFVVTGIDHGAARRQGVDHGERPRLTRSDAAAPLVGIAQPPASVRPPRSAMMWSGGCG